MRKFAMLGIALGGFALLVACDELALPPQPPGADGGGNVTPQGDGGGQPVTGIAPAGAILGESVEKVGGTVETWAVLDSGGKVSEFSWTLPITTITGIPPTTKTDVVFFVKVPDPVVQQTFVKSLDYSFLPAGHVPAGVYDTPHWEWHVSTMTQTERDTIDCKDNTMPGVDNIPANWIVFPECIVKIGYHGFDLAAPEYNRQRFTKGNYISYWKGIFGGIEPQITRELLLTRTDQDFNPPPTMKKLGVAGLYPGKFSSKYNAEKEIYVFTLSQWTPAPQ